MNPDRWLEYARRVVDDALPSYLALAVDAAGRLQEGMRYAVLDGGKRIRPVLCLAACEAAGGDMHRAVPAACAVELVHCYSLVHDDLPAMDDDDLRRGRPTVHRAFGEGMAVLVGDALLTLAFEILARDTRGIPAPAVIEITATLARAAGPAGMVAGQAMDLEAEGKPPDLAYLESMHRLKTGRLIWAAVRSGGLVAAAPDSVSGSLEAYATHLGLIYQITDDLLDVRGQRGAMGKNPGADVRKHKLTYPALVGIEQSEHIARAAAARADQALSGVPEPRVLAHILDLVVSRDR